jgi:hypothetical protein
MDASLAAPLNSTRHPGRSAGSIRTTVVKRSTTSGIVRAMGPGFGCAAPG